MAGYLVEPQPILKNMLVKLDYETANKDDNKKYLKAPPRFNT